MLVVTVLFTIKPAEARAFREAKVANARASLEREPGCRQFDVTVDPNDPAAIFLYEVYADRAAFDAHLASDHFLRFDRETRDWIATKVVRMYERVDP